MIIFDSKYKTRLLEGFPTPPITPLLSKLVNLSPAPTFEDEAVEWPL